MIPIYIGTGLLAWCAPCFGNCAMARGAHAQILPLTTIANNLISTFKLNFVIYNSGNSLIGQHENVAKKETMKLLLTSTGISNTSIRKALVKLPGKPIAEANTPSWRV